MRFIAARPTRRALASGVLWSLPALAVARAAPAFAASGCCYTIKWNQKTGKVAGATFGSSAIAPCTGVGPTVIPTILTSTPTQQPTYNMTVGTKVGYSGTGTQVFTVPSLPGPMLILNQGNSTSTSETILFSFSATVKSLSFTLYDLSSATTGIGQYTYWDQVKFSSAITSSGGDAVANWNATSGPAGTWFYPKSSNIQSAANQAVLITASAVNSTTFSVTYGDKASGGYQFIAIGDFRICV